MHYPKAAFAALLVSPCVLLGPALAQDRKPVASGPERPQKVLIDNPKVRVTESNFRPGDSNPMVDRAFRVVRVLSGSTTIERTYVDGKTETLQYKEGDTYAVGPDKVSLKNIGAGEIVTLTVTLKQP